MHSFCSRWPLTILVCFAYPAHTPSTTVCSRVEQRSFPLLLSRVHPTALLLQVREWGERTSSTHDRDTADVARVFRPFGLERFFPKRVMRCGGNITFAQNSAGTMTQHSAGATQQRPLVRPALRPSPVQSHSRWFFFRATNTLVHHCTTSFTTSSLRSKS
jgi:hypothetical protein